MEYVHSLTHSLTHSRTHTPSHYTQWIWLHLHPLTHKTLIVCALLASHHTITKHSQPVKNIKPTKFDKIGPKFGKTWQYWTKIWQSLDKKVKSIPAININTSLTTGMASNSVMCWHNWHPHSADGLFILLGMGRVDAHVGACVWIQKWILNLANNVSKKVEIVSFLFMVLRDICNDDQHGIHAVWVTMGARDVYQEMSCPLVDSSWFKVVFVGSKHANKLIFLRYESTDLIVIHWA